MKKKDYVSPYAHDPVVQHIIAANKAFGRDQKNIPSELQKRCAVEKDATTFSLATQMSMDNAWISIYGKLPT